MNASESLSSFQISFGSEPGFTSSSDTTLGSIERNEEVSSCEMVAWRRTAAEAVGQIAGRKQLVPSSEEERTFVTSSTPPRNQAGKLTSKNRPVGPAARHAQLGCSKCRRSRAGCSKCRPAPVPPSLGCTKCRHSSIGCSRCRAWVAAAIAEPERTELRDEGGDGKGDATAALASELDGAEAVTGGHGRGKRRIEEADSEPESGEEEEEVQQGEEEATLPSPPLQEKPSKKQRTEVNPPAATAAAAERTLGCTKCRHAAIGCSRCRALAPPHPPPPPPPPPPQLGCSKCRHSPGGCKACRTKAAQAGGATSAGTSARGLAPAPPLAAVERRRARRLSSSPGASTEKTTARPLPSPPSPASVGHDAAAAAQQQATPPRDELWWDPADAAKVRQAKAALHVSAASWGEVPLCRERQAAAIDAWLEGHISGAAGGSLYLSGLPGTGKSLTALELVRRCGRHAAAPASRCALPPALLAINCMRLTEPRQVVARILAGYKAACRRPAGRDPLVCAAAGEDGDPGGSGRASGGGSPGEALDQLQQLALAPLPPPGSCRDRPSAAGERGMIVVVLDELDSLLAGRHGDSLVEDLFSLAHADRSRLLLVGIANSIDLVERLMRPGGSLHVSTTANCSRRRCSSHSTRPLPAAAALELLCTPEHSRLPVESGLPRRALSVSAHLKPGEPSRCPARWRLSPAAPQPAPRPRGVPRLPAPPGVEVAKPAPGRAARAGAGAQRPGVLRPQGGKRQRRHAPRAGGVRSGGGHRGGGACAAATSRRRRARP